MILLGPSDGRSLSTSGVQRSVRMRRFDRETTVVFIDKQTVAHGIKPLEVGVTAGRVKNGISCRDHANGGFCRPLQTAQINGDMPMSRVADLKADQ